LIQTSVIIPAHNAQRYLAEALDSVFAQNIPDLEVLLINDRSTDATLAVASRYPSVRILHNEGRPGPAAARNVGLRAAQGRYIAFLDADDRWRPQKLALQWDLLRQPPFPNFVFGDIEQYRDATGQFLSRQKGIHCTCLLARRRSWPDSFLRPRSHCRAPPGPRRHHGPRPNPHKRLPAHSEGAARFAALMNPDILILKAALAPTDHLFHAMIHGVQYNPFPASRWVADAVTLIRYPRGIDWQRLRQLTLHYNVAPYIALAAQILREQFHIEVPPLEFPAPSWWLRQEFRRETTNWFSTSKPVFIASTLHRYRRTGASFWNLGRLARFCQFQWDLTTPAGWRRNWQRFRG
jgi:hypothetical protein